MTVTTAVTVELLPTSSLHVDPVNPRPEPGNVDDLAASIADIGIVNPLIVRPDGDGFGVLSGQRRLTAARQAGVDTVPCLVREPATDADALAIATAENVGRKAMDPISEARTFRRLLDELGCTQADLGRRLGVSEFTVSVRLQLLALPDDVQEQVRTGELSVSRAYKMLKKSRGPKKKPRGKTKPSACDCADRPPPARAPAGTKLVPLPVDALVMAGRKAARARKPLAAWIVEALRDAR